MKKSLRRRQLLALIIVALGASWLIFENPQNWQLPSETPATEVTFDQQNLATTVLQKLEVKGRAPKTGYQRAQFGSGWISQNGCDMRNIILNRDLNNIETNDKCQVTKGTLKDPYTGETIEFVRGENTSQAVQIDHVVALSNAWQTGAQNLSQQQRLDLANDPLNLIATSGHANQQKSDGDAATWLPANKSFRCQYVSRQVAVKQKYELWLTVPEKQAIGKILQECPQQALPNA